MTMKIMDNMKSTLIPEYLHFPKTLSPKEWSKYLGRSLTDEERFVLTCCHTELHTNKMLKGLYEQCLKKNLRFYVPLLTHLDGNCMFESLTYHGICENHLQLRYIISTILFLFSDYKETLPNGKFKGFLPNTDLSLSEMFTMTNEIDYVLTRKYVGGDCIKQFYKYTYNVMCQDVASMYSWSKLPTHLIMLVISYIYKLELVIISNTGEYEHKINAYDSSPIKPELKTIYLGHLGESHYVPLDVLKVDEELEPLFYTDAKNNLVDWGYEVESIKVKNYLDEINKEITGNLSFDKFDIDDQNIDNDMLNF